MSKLLLKLPWFISAPLIAVVVAGFAYLGYAVTGDYFNEQCKNERNPLSGEFEPSNCGEGASIAAKQNSGPTTTADRQAAAVATSTGATAASPQAAQPATATASSSPSPSSAAATPSASSPARASSPAATGIAPATAVATAAPATASPSPTQTPTPTPTPAVPAAPTVAAAPKPGILAAGTFKNGAPGHNGSGTVQVQRLADGKLNLFISNFSVTNGPDLYVVLSASPGGSYSGADLQVAKLKANNGSQNYALPDGLDLSGYRSVIIWCKSFDVVFSYAPVVAQ